MPRVTSLETFRVREPVSKRSYNTLRLRTDSVLTGYGECGGATPPTEVAQARKLLAGRDPTAYEVIRRDCASLTTLAGGINIALLDMRHD